MANSFFVNFLAGCGDIDTDDVLPPEVDMTTEELQQEPSSFFSVICCFTVFNSHALNWSILPVVLSIKRVSPSTSCSKPVEKNTTK